MVIRTNAKDLAKYVDSKNLLKEWGGEFEFDINKCAAPFYPRTHPLTHPLTHAPNHLHTYLSTCTLTPTHELGCGS